MSELFLLLFLQLHFLFLLRNDIVLVLALFLNGLILFGFTFSLQAPKLLLPLRHIPLGIGLVVERRDMRRQLLDIVPVLLDMQEPVEVYRIVDPLGLDVLLCLYESDV